MSFEKLILVVVLLTMSCKEAPKQVVNTESEGFQIDEDLLLVHYDCKTDVDDLHSIAAFATLASHSNFSNLQFHAVAGAYGTQEGLYVPPNDLFRLAFGNNWTDAHENFDAAVAKVSGRAMQTLNQKGDIWIAEAGQSDFSAALIKAIQNMKPDTDTKQRIHVIQHSEWNESVTGVDNLVYVQQHSDYEKIPDGNAEGNGTPGFRSPEFSDWKSNMTNSRLIEIWNLAITLGNTYNGVDGRYLNEAIRKGGMDFSDFSEVCWILDLLDIKDPKDFFEQFGH